MKMDVERTRQFRRVQTVDEFPGYTSCSLGLCLQSETQIDLSSFLVIDIKFKFRALGIDKWCNRSYYRYSICTECILYKSTGSNLPLQSIGINLSKFPQLLLCLVPGFHQL